MSRVLVCWSGGCDSTLLLHEAARVHGTPQSPVRAVAITCDQVTARAREKRARARLLREFRKQGLHVALTEIHIETVSGNGIATYGLPQAILWLYASQMLGSDEHLALGYVRGDDWTVHQREFLHVFDSLQRIGGRAGRLLFPLCYIEKRAVLGELSERKLLDLTWWCEIPPEHKGREPCGKCHSCQRHETALWQLERHGAGYAQWNVEP